jgi:hypothetical protein
MIPRARRVVKRRSSVRCADGEQGSLVLLHRPAFAASVATDLG